MEIAGTKIKTGCDKKDMFTLEGRAMHFRLFWEPGNDSFGWVSGYPAHPFQKILPIPGYKICLTQTILHNKYPSKSNNCLCCLGS